MSQLNDTNRRFILASGSPRRLELMQNLGFEPEVRVSSIPEQQQPEESPTDYTRRLAFAKARDVADSFEGDDSLPDWVLAADTIVIFEDEVLEKPQDPDDAFQMLRSMSGREHVVETSFCWLQRSTGDYSVCSVQADVEFRELTDEMIQRYLDSGEPFDKAGSYGIQLLGSAFVRALDGSYFAVVGLPVCEVVEELQKLGGLEGFPFRS